MANNDILVETIHFRLADSVTEEAFLKASDELQDHVFERIDGFLSREVTKEDGTKQWTIIVRFKDAKSCNRASSEVMASESGSKLLKMINPSSMQMTRSILIKEYVKG